MSLKDCQCPGCQGHRFTIRRQLRVLEKRPGDAQAIAKIRAAREHLKGKDH